MLLVNKMAISSIKLAKIQVPFLLVEFILKKFDEDEELRILLELNKEELQGFLEKLYEIDVLI